MEKLYICLNQLRNLREYQYDKPVYWFWFLLYFLFPFTIISIIHGINLYKADKVKCYNFSTHEGFVDDGRYKSGIRSTGIKTIRNDMILTIDECPEEIVEQKKKAALIILSPVIILFGLFVVLLLVSIIS